MMHICVGNLTIIGSDNGLSPGRRQAIIWTNAGILLIGPLGTNFSEILIEIHTFSFNKMHLKMSSTKWRPFCPGLNVLILWSLVAWWQQGPRHQQPRHQQPRYWHIGPGMLQSPHQKSYIVWVRLSGVLLSIHWKLHIYVWSFLSLCQCRDELMKHRVIPGLYSFSGKTSYGQISWSLEAPRLVDIMIISLWNLTGISAAVLMCLSNFRLEKFKPESRGFGT